VLLKVSDTSYDTAWFDNYAATVQATVRNETGATLTKGTVVYISGGSGNKPLVTKASASTEASSSKTFAILAENISNNNNGQAVTMGLLKGLDTSAFTAGANLWLSTTAGQIVSPTPPASPAHAVFLGNVVRVHATQGEIEVRIQNGLELGELHDVLIDTPANGQVLKYDSAQGLWINGTDSSGVAWGAITGTLSSQTDLQTALDGKYSTSNPSGYITSSALSPYLTSATAASTYQPLSGMSSYLTTSSAASTYQTISGMSSYLTTSTAASTYLTQSNAASTYQTQAGMTNYLSKAGNLSGLASTSTARTNLGLGTLSTVNDAPADGSQYARKNNTWEVVSGGGGSFTGGPITTPITYTVGTQVSTMQNGGFNVTNSANSETVDIVTAGVYVYGSGGVMAVYSQGIQFPDTSIQTTAGIGEAAYDGVAYCRKDWGWVPAIQDAPIDGNYYVRKDGAWVQCTVVGIYDGNSGNTYNCLTV
jgi:hypothetical protein